MESQTSNLSIPSLPLSDQTFKYLQDQIEDQNLLQSSILNEFTSIKKKSGELIGDQIGQIKCKEEPAADDSEENILEDDDIKFNKEKNSAPIDGAPLLGEFKFDVFFEEAERASKSINSTYSNKLETLFAKPQVPVYAVISTDGEVPLGTRIYVTPLYNCHKFRNDSVMSCPNHALTSEPESSRHLIRINTDEVEYGVIPRTNHHFVAVDYYRMSGGKHRFKISLKFMCFSSCNGGIARRPFHVIYWLQKGNMILGQKLVKTHLCSSPGRDVKTKENENLLPDASRHKRKHSSSTSEEIANNENSNAAVKMQTKNVSENSGKKSYTVTVSSYQHFCALKKLKTHLQHHPKASCNCKQFFSSQDCWLQTKT